MTTRKAERRRETDGREGERSVIKECTLLYGISILVSVRLYVMIFKLTQFSSKRLRIFEIGILQLKHDPLKMITIE